MPLANRHQPLLFPQRWQLLAIALSGAVALPVQAMPVGAIARDSKGTELYREQRIMLRAGGEVQSIEVLYRDPGGTLIGRKKLDFVESPSKPDITITQCAGGEHATLRREGKGWVWKHVPAGERLAKARRMKLGATALIDDALLIHLEQNALQWPPGEVQRLALASVKHSRARRLNAVSQRQRVQGREVLRVEIIRPRMFGGDQLDSVYTLDATTGQLIGYEGPSTFPCGPDLGPVSIEYE